MKPTPFSFAFFRHIKNNAGRSITTIDQPVVTKRAFTPAERRSDTVIVNSSVIGNVPFWKAQWLSFWFTSECPVDPGLALGNM